MSRAEQRNYSIDTLKFFLCFLVILIHCGGPLSIEIINSVAVPCFFVISGYFLYYSDRSKMQLKLKSTIKKIAIITFWSSILYASISLILPSSEGSAESGLTLERIVKETFKLIVYHKAFWGFHLWYLFAYIYSLISIYLLNKYNLIRLSYYFVPFLLSINVLFGLYALVIFDDFIPAIGKTRNFLFVGIPYFLIGMLIKKKYEFLHKMVYVIYGFAILFVLLSIFEYVYIDPRGSGLGKGAFFITTAPMTILTILVTLSIKQTKDNIFSKIGREYSLYIYVFHIMTREILIQFNVKIDENWWYAISVFLVTIVISILFKKSVVPIYQSVIKKFC